MTSPCTIVAEIGCNHMGDMDVARRFIEVCQTFCGVRHIKFQKRNPKVLLPEKQYTAPHPVPENSYGPTYGAHREYLEFDLDQHRELKQLCDARGMVYSCSVWDIPSLRDIVLLNPEYIKIPSATNTHFELLEEICTTFGGKIHISLGMTTRAEEQQIMALIRKSGRSKDVVLYACTSGLSLIHI